MTEVIEFRKQTSFISVFLQFQKCISQAAQLSEISSNLSLLAAQQQSYE